MTRTCALPGCNHSIAHRSARTKYCDDRHRQAHYRARVKAAATAAGLPPNLSLTAVQQSTPTNHRNGDAQKPRKGTKRRSGKSIRISYRKALDSMAAYLERDQLVHNPRAEAEAALSPLLTDRQRQELRHD